ncbi:helix-turn-helix domain-containing protein [Sphingopyxis flava]|uniref:DNA-binding transcriptional regulator, XRE-family HTH domain n=1 Tax=Sphingopyxis flava TaxID=1507287 RepID=A0A1T5DG67_9SPHN|nr:helix-turn-helix domain-containing protein [Sphingopyxis flava]SKB70702.1 DNA-binding transcriptional regulator, XRE-family HTH domain [Sphingopyxis flava]
MAIPAYIETGEVRGAKSRSPRRTLRLQLPGAKATGDDLMVQVHNISASGLLIESEVALAIGERIEIDLPHAGPTGARIIWNSAHIYGCQFDTAITSATLSAAQLRSIVGPDARVSPRPRSAESFGTRLQRLRMARGLTQSQMAKQLAVSEPSISAWEQGKARPKPGRMEALAALLGTDVSELLGLEEGECLGDVIARAKKDIARAAKLSPENIKVVIEV